MKSIQIPMRFDLEREHVCMTVYACVCVWVCVCVCDEEYVQRMKNVSNHLTFLLVK
jgi:hypothetical protein